MSSSADSGLPLSFDGVLLAAGHSLRMGREKALLPGPWGTALWERQWELLRQAGAGRRWLSARPGQAWIPDGIEIVQDPTPDAGPLGGILAGWAASKASHLMVVAVDLPDVPAGWLDELSRGCRTGIGAVGKHADGQFEPLAAIYPRAWCPRWLAALQDGRHSLQRLLRAESEAGLLHERRIQPHETRYFRNLNRPEDCREA